MSLLRRWLGGKSAPSTPHRAPTLATEDLPKVWLDGACQTDVGLVRDNNEDAVRLMPDPQLGVRLAVLADGMGGHACGEVASALAIEAVMAHMGIQDEAMHSPETWLAQLSEAVAVANHRVWQHAQDNPETSGMGTTLCVLSFAHGRAYWAWVGDSRVYVVKDGMTKQLTRDDTVVNRFIDEGVLNAEQAAKHPDAHVLSQALGTHEFVERVNVCVSPMLLEVGSRFVLTSDGVHDPIAAPDWDLALQTSPAHVTVRALIEAAKLAESADNLSAIVVDIGAPRNPSSVAAATRH